MRVSGTVIGIVGFVLLIIFTGICSFATFNITRDVVVDSNANGIVLESPLDLVQAIVNPADFAPTNTPSPTSNGIVTIPSITPVSTVAATQDPSVSPVATELVQELPTLEATTAVSEEFAVERWGDPREINILLMGIDERQGFTTDRAYRTDTMMVLHIDPVRKTASIISFPRDLYVTIPNYNARERLNTANDIGDRQAYPNGEGPGLLMETLNVNFGLRINYYVRINFTVFETVIDQIAPDGIEVCPNERIYDDHYPDEGFGTIIVEFPAGCQRLEGQRLLQYARTRSTQGGDFDRAARQQEVIRSVQSYVLSAGGVQNFIGNLAPLWDTLQGSYRTNLSLNEITRLAFLMNEIDEIDTRVITPVYTVPTTLEDGTQVLLPIHSEIQRLIQETFYPGAALTVADLRTRAEAENVTIQIFNNTTTAGLARQTEEFLLGRGVAINALGNMPSPSNQNTVIRYYSTGRDTALYLAELLGLPASRVELGGDGLTATGVVIVVGPDMPELLRAAGN